MLQSFDNLIEPSIFCWIDNLLLSRGSAFYNVGENFQPQTNRYPGFSSYLSSKPQWVYDSSIAGANIPSGVFINGAFCPNNQSGLALDYLHGQALFSNGQKSIISGNYSAKEINVYATSEREETLLFEKKNFVNPKNLPNWTGRHQGDNIVPCIFVKTNVGTNTPISFCGNMNTEVEARLVFISDNYFLYTAAASLFRDSMQTYMPLLAPSDLPFDPYGNLKSGNFDYGALQRNSDPNNMIYVAGVKVSPFDEYANFQIGKGAVGGFIDIKFSVYRFPKTYKLISNTPINPPLNPPTYLRPDKSSKYIRPSGGGYNRSGS